MGLRGEGGGKRLCWVNGERWGQVAGRERERGAGDGVGGKETDLFVQRSVRQTDGFTEISHKTCAICPYEKMCSGTCSPTPTILTEASQPCVKVGYGVGGGGGGILKGGGKEKTKSFR